MLILDMPPQHELGRPTRSASEAQPRYWLGDGFEPERRVQGRCSLFEPGYGCFR